MYGGIVNTQEGNLETRLWQRCLAQQHYASPHTQLPNNSMDRFGIVKNRQSVSQQSSSKNYYHEKLTACPPACHLSPLFIHCPNHPATLTVHYLFLTYHDSPVAGHMGIYKTLHRLRKRFFWPKMRLDILGWIKRYPKCAAYNVWRNFANELHFSWPVTSPFYIVRVGIWKPGTVMCDEGNACL